MKHFITRLGALFSLSLFLPIAAWAQVELVFDLSQEMAYVTGTYSSPPIPIQEDSSPTFRLAISGSTQGSNQGQNIINSSTTGLGTGWAIIGARDLRISSVHQAVSIYVGSYFFFPASNLPSSP